MVLPLSGLLGKKKKTSATQRQTQSLWLNMCSSLQGSEHRGCSSDWEPLCHHLSAEAPFWHGRRGHKSRDFCCSPKL